MKTNTLFFSIFTIAFTSSIFIYFLYQEQKYSHKNNYIDFCKKGCTYFFPKELHPKITSINSKNEPTLNIRYKIRDKYIYIWINLPNRYFEYPENYDEKDQEKYSIYPKKSRFYDNFHKKYYYYFYDKNNNKVVFIDNSLVLRVDKKINDHLIIRYRIPSELISEIITIDEEITEKINSLKVN